VDLGLQRVPMTAAKRSKGSKMYKRNICAGTCHLYYMKYFFPLTKAQKIGIYVG
jgi:hypothetical protein